MGVILNIVLQNRITSEKLNFPLVRTLTLSRFMAISSGKYIDSIKLLMENGKVFHYPSAEWFVCYADKFDA